MSSPGAASDRSQGPGLKPFATSLWLAEGPVVSVAGFRYPTRMAVVKLADASLFIWSPVALGSALKDEVAALGKVSHIVAPNSLHHLHLAEWKAAFPQARLHAAPGLRSKRRDLSFEADLVDAPDPAWKGQLEQVIVKGNLITSEVVFFHRESRTVLFTDLLQNFPPGWFAGWRAAVARMDLMLGAQPQVPRKFRVAFINRPAARESVRQILAWPSGNVIMAHGTPVIGNGADFIRQAFGWLVR